MSCYFLFDLWQHIADCAQSIPIMKFTFWADLKQRLFYCNCLFALINHRNQILANRGDRFEICCRGASQTSVTYAESKSSHKIDGSRASRVEVNIKLHSTIFKLLLQFLFMLCLHHHNRPKYTYSTQG